MIGIGDHSVSKLRTALKIKLSEISVRIRKKKKMKVPGKMDKKLLQPGIRSGCAETLQLQLNKNNGLSKKNATSKEQVLSSTNALVRGHTLSAISRRIGLYPCELHVTCSCNNKNIIRELCHLNRPQ